MCVQISKQRDQMSVALQIAVAQQPTSRLDESLQQQLSNQEGYVDSMRRLERAEPPELNNAFSYAAPKFISPAPPRYDLALQVVRKQLAPGALNDATAALVFAARVCTPPRISRIPIPGASPPHFVPFGAHTLQGLKR